MSRGRWNVVRFSQIQMPHGYAVFSKVPMPNGYAVFSKIPIPHGYAVFLSKVRPYPAIRGISSTDDQ